MIRHVARLLGNLLRRRRVEGDLTAEVDSYVELLVAEKVAQGMTADAALRAARLELGSADEVKERVRDVRAGVVVERMVRNVRFGLRSLRRTPGFTTFTVLTFALAIGGITVIFSLVDALLLRPLPYPGADRIVMVMQADAANPGNGTILSAPNFLDLERRNRVFDRMALYEYLGFNLSGDGEPEQVGGLRASSGLFQVLGVKPILGRGFVAGDDEPGSQRVVVLSHGLWQRRFGGDSSIVGRPIRINQLPYVVIGVMPRGFAFPGAHQSLWTSISFNGDDQSRGSQSFLVVARLKTGISLERGRSEIRTLGDQLAREYPAPNGGTTDILVRLRDLWMENAERTLTALMAAVFLVLVIASANIASLLVARGSARRREIAARMALGGTRGQVMAQLVTESVLLAMAGAAAGLGLAAIGIKALLAILPPGLRYVPFRDLSGLSVNLSVFLFALGVALLAGVVSGIAPALAILPAEPAEVLRDTDGRGMTARRGRYLRNALVGGEIALAVVVLVGAGLLISSITRVRGVDPGLDPSNVMVMDMELPQREFYGSPTRLHFCQALAREVGGVGGVASVSAISHLPLQGGMASRGFVIEGEPLPTPADEPGASYGVICPNYFRTMGIPLREGRDFDATDRSDAPLVAIVNESLRQKYFPKGSPVGRRIRFSLTDASEPWVTIVGMAADVHQAGLQSQRSPFLYRPYSQTVWPSVWVVVRGRASPIPLAGAVRKALARVDADSPVGTPSTMENVVERSLGHLQFPLLLFSAFAVMAVTLAAIGIFGVASQSVVQRTRELGIRRALGASDRQLFRMVIGQAMTPVGWGIGAGVLGGLAATKILKGLLFGIEPTDPPTFAIVALVVAGVAIIACAVPARRAARVDPIVALRDG